MNIIMNNSNNMSYYNKYLKYKQKYLLLKHKLHGGSNFVILQPSYEYILTSEKITFIINNRNSILTNDIKNIIKTTYKINDINCLILANNIRNNFRNNKESINDTNTTIVYKITEMLEIILICTCISIAYNIVNESDNFIKIIKNIITILNECYLHANNTQYFLLLDDHSIPIVIQLCYYKYFDTITNKYIFISKELKTFDIFIELLNYKFEKEEKMIFNTIVYRLFNDTQPRLLKQHSQLHNYIYTNFKHIKTYNIINIIDINKLENIDLMNTLNIKFDNNENIYNNTMLVFMMLLFGMPIRIYNPKHKIDYIDIVYNTMCKLYNINNIYSINNNKEYIYLYNIDKYINDEYDIIRKNNDTSQEYINKTICDPTIYNITIRENLLYYTIKLIKEGNNICPKNNICDVLYELTDIIIKLINLCDDVLNINKIQQYSLINDSITTKLKTLQTMIISNPSKGNIFKRLFKTPEQKPSEYNTISKLLNNLTILLNHIPLSKDNLKNNIDNIIIPTTNLITYLKKVIKNSTNIDNTTEILETRNKNLTDAINDILEKYNTTEKNNIDYNTINNIKESDIKLSMFFKHYYNILHLCKSSTESDDNFFRHFLYYCILTISNNTSLDAYQQQIKNIIYNIKQITPSNVINDNKKYFIDTIINIFKSQLGQYLYGYDIQLFIQKIHKIMKYSRELIIINNISDNLVKYYTLFLSIMLIFIGNTDYNIIKKDIYYNFNKIMKSITGNDLKEKKLSLYYTVIINKINENKKIHNTYIISLLDIINTLFDTCDDICIINEIIEIYTVNKKLNIDDKYRIIDKVSITTIKDSLSK